MRKQDGLADVRAITRTLAAHEKKVEVHRQRRDAAIRAALRQTDPDSERPKPRYSAEEVGKAAGLSRQAVTKIGADS